MATTITEGVSLGPYEILSRIGEGGMGVVWRARDRRMGRDVAVKVMRESFSEGDERIRRFEQEARTAGALNHPGLLTILDVGTTDHSPYIVMELLEGRNLREILDASLFHPLPLWKVIHYGTQIAIALAVAHEKGIIHRDLKPENLFVTPDDRVKILDFGLAKLAREVTEEESTRRTAIRVTDAGVVVGTPGYMSPEQARAQLLDHRTDIFSLGAVLYEMISGRPAFEGLSVVETLHAVVAVDPPPLKTFVPNVPPALDAIVRHCLEKNVRERFHSATDLAFQLRMVNSDQATATFTYTQAGTRRWLPSRSTMVMAALLLAVAAAGFTLLHFFGGAASTVSSRKLTQLTFGDGVESFPTLAPDGKTFAYVSTQSGNRDIYVQRVDGRMAMNITSDSADDDFEPAFSPDGSQIIFRSERDGGGLFLMSATGESVRRLTDFGHNPSWSPDGKRVVVATESVEMLPHVRMATSELWLVDTSTGARKPLVQARKGGPDFGRDSDAVQPSWSPDGKRIAFWGLSNWFAQRDLWTIDPDAPQPKQTVVRVTSGPDLHWNPVWSPDGRYLYYGSDRDGTLNLWRIPMDEESGKPAGTPELLALPASISGQFSVSREGEMTYVMMTRQYELMALPFDASGAATGIPTTGAVRPVLSGSQEILTFQPSPDGQSIAYTTGGGAQEDLFVARVDGTGMRQLTRDPAKDRSAVWSHDGRTLYFYSNRDGGYHIWSIRADGSDLTRITNDDDVKRIGAQSLYSPNVSPDGKTLAIQTDRSSALVHLDRPPGRRLERLPVMLAEPKWSPDGTKIVGTDDTSSPARGGIVVYSLSTRESERLADRGFAPQWVGDSSTKIVFFQPQAVGIVDLTTHKTTTAPLAQAVVQLILRHPRLSRDGSTIYLLHTVEQGDVWLIRFANG